MSPGVWVIGTKRIFKAKDSKGVKGSESWDVKMMKQSQQRKLRRNGQCCRETSSSFAKVMMGTSWFINIHRQLPSQWCSRSSETYGQRVRIRGELRASKNKQLGKFLSALQLGYISTFTSTHICFALHI